MWSYIAQLLIFLGSVVVIIIEIIKIIKELRKPKKSYWKLISAIFVLCMVTILGAWGKIYANVTVNGEFSKRKGNLEQRDGAKNICLLTKHRVYDIVSLKIKDSWTYLQPETDYELQNENTIFVKFIYGEDKTKNRWLAEHGLMLTYKTRLFLFDPVYIDYCWKRGKVLKE